VEPAPGARARRPLLFGAPLRSRSAAKKGHRALIFAGAKRQDPRHRTRRHRAAAAMVAAHRSPANSLERSGQATAVATWHRLWPAPGAGLGQPTKDLGARGREAPHGDVSKGVDDIAHPTADAVDIATAAVRQPEPDQALRGHDDHILAEIAARHEGIAWSRRHAPGGLQSGSRETQGRPQRDPRGTLHSRVGQRKDGCTHASVSPWMVRTIPGDSGHQRSLQTASPPRVRARNHPRPACA